jgi:hypothetical protein
MASTPANADPVVPYTFACFACLATVTVAADRLTVRFHRRAHLPIIIDSGMLDRPVAVPWWNGASLRLTA